MVLPPAASAVLAAGNGTYDARTDLTLKRYAYVYRYDERLNCVEKRMPGCEPIRYAYDRTGTKVFSQDGNQRQRGVWSFALLDRFGREAVTGECQNPDSVVLAKKWVHVDTPDFAARESTLGGSGYRSNVNLGNVRLLTANYYDDYTFISALWPDHNLPLPTTSGLRGLQTGSIKAVGNTMDYNTTLIGYDDEGRINFTQSAIAGRTMTEEKNYTLDGRVSQIRKETTEADGNRHTETYSYRYDAQARLLKVTHSLDGGAEMTLLDNEYDELGRLLTDRREGSGLLTARYSYDIHSHIRKMVSPLFCQRLFYAEPSGGGIPLYGGAISGMDWQTIGDSVRSYRYQYDGLGRLTSADYLESGHSSDRYVTEYSYDLMGNILTLSRSGKVYDEIYGITDDLTYQYDGNRLIRVTNHAADTPAYKDAMYYADGADLDTERTYDANGNMTSNADSRISRISYDALNMPCRIDYIDGSHIDYTYAADGAKQRVDYYLNPYTSSLPDDDFGTACDSSLLVHTWREYAGNCVYVCDTLSMILIDGGYITFDYATHQPIYHYYLKDYLGNNRITVSLVDGRIEEVNHYYPFGGLMGDSRNATTQPYKYIGKELDRTHGLDWYDHGARHYDPVTGRWNVMDALAEKYYPWSPYVSCGDDPVNNLDLNGCDTININYNSKNEKWIIESTIKAKGDDIFIVTRDGETSTFVFSEGDYGERVDCLNLEIGKEKNVDITLGIYHVSGTDGEATGFYATPGGEPNNTENSKARIEDKTYKITTPYGREQWQQPGVGSDVVNRGIRFHSGKGDVQKWTKGCFVLFPDYVKIGNKFYIDGKKSIDSLKKFDLAMGAYKTYIYDYKNQRRLGARFTRPINKILNLKSR